MPERERQIAKRLRQIRKETRLSMVAFADAIGVDTGRYSRYEYGYVPLPYTVGNEVCERFNIPLRRLAEGNEVVAFYIPPHGQVTKQIDANAYFSQAFDGVLKEWLDKVEAEVSTSPASKARWESVARGSVQLADEIDQTRMAFMAVISDAIARGNIQQQIAVLESVREALQKVNAAYPGVVDFNVPEIQSVTIRRKKK